MVAQLVAYQGLGERDIGIFLVDRLRIDQRDALSLVRDAEGFPLKDGSVPIPAYLRYTSKLPT